MKVFDSSTGQYVAGNRQVVCVKCFELNGEPIKCIFYDDCSEKYFTSSTTLIQTMSADPCIATGIEDALEKLAATCRSRRGTFPICCGGNGPAFPAASADNTPPTVEDIECVIMSCLPAGATEVPCASTISVVAEMTEIEKFIEVGCLTQNGVSRQVEMVKTVNSNGSITSVTYHEIGGEQIETTTSDTISLGKCRRACTSCRSATT